MVLYCLTLTGGRGLGGLICISLTASLYVGLLGFALACCLLMSLAALG